MKSKRSKQAVDAINMKATLSQSEFKGESDGSTVNMKSNQDHSELKVNSKIIEVASAFLKLKPERNRHEINARPK